MDSRNGRLAAQNQARHPGALPLPLSDDLVAADAGADFTAGSQVRAGQEVAGLATVDAADERFGVVQAAKEVHLFAERLERPEHLAKLHLGPFAACPPLLAVEAITREQASETHRRLRITLL